MATTMATHPTPAEAAAEEEESGISKLPPVSGGRWKRTKKGSSTPVAPINCLDDGCLMHIFSLLSPIPGSWNSPPRPPFLLWINRFFFKPFVFCEL